MKLHPFIDLPLKEFITDMMTEKMLPTYYKLASSAGLIMKTEGDVL